jgi:hypothetical protein
MGNSSRKGVQSFELLFLVNPDQRFVSSIGNAVLLFLIIITFIYVFVAYFDTKK